MVAHVNNDINKARSRYSRSALFRTTDVLKTKIELKKFFLFRVIKPRIEQPQTGDDG